MGRFGPCHQRVLFPKTFFGLPWKNVKRSLFLMSSNTFFYKFLVDIFISVNSSDQSNRQVILCTVCPGKLTDVLSRYK